PPAARARLLGRIGPPAGAEVRARERALAPDRDAIELLPAHEQPRRTQPRGLLRPARRVRAGVPGAQRRSRHRRGVPPRRRSRRRLTSMAESSIAVRRPAVFYRWYIVGVALVAQFVAAGTSTYAAGVFLKPMTQDLGWSRGDFSAVQTVSTFVRGLLGLFIGVQLDKRGPRSLMFAGGVIAGAALILLSAVHSLWQFYLVRGVGQTAGNAMLGNLVVNVTLSRWFVARRGMAVAI